jgi:hypothetical protein
MLRFAGSGSFVALLSAVMACGSGDMDKDPDVAKGCEALCDAQRACGTAGPSDVPCADACIADVGTPGVECGRALEAWAACVQAACEKPCTEEQGARDDACGGTG